jgi:hypothetical protein
MVMCRRERAVARGAGHGGFDDGEDFLAVFSAVSMVGALGGDQAAQRPLGLCGPYRLRPALGGVLEITDDVRQTA